MEVKESNNEREGVGCMTDVDYPILENTCNYHSMVDTYKNKPRDMDEFNI